MKLIKNLHEFYEKVGFLIDIQYSHGIPLEPCWGVLGLFKPHRLPELMAFVEKNPEYHIISMLENFVYLNKIISNCYGYYLGEGDKDPEIVYGQISDELGAFEYEEKCNDPRYCWDPFNLNKKSDSA